jgi:cytolysin-activating lysine-acyltransferase
MKNIEAIGKIVWLMGQSKVHQAHDISDLHRVVLPPVALQQYRIWEADDYPVGYMSYALFNEEAETAFIHNLRFMEPEDWRSGEKLWLVDFIAPFGNVREIVREGRSHLRSLFGKGVLANARRLHKGKTWFAVT